ncbi:MAG: molybdenum cofactor guanylyltransferase [Candidatus Hodarchaeales archaeon]|jgi:molybdopterin-guanine dinucleotide biosynthesis protein A
MSSFDLAILSGGKGRQFQSRAKSGKDKALAEVNGQTILEILVSRFLGLADHLLLICGSTQRCKTYKSILKPSKEELGTRLKLIPDSTQYDLAPSPLRGILTALDNTTNKRLVTIPNDMPFLLREHILPLVDQTSNSEICTPIWPNRCLQPLISAYQSDKFLQCAALFGILKRNRADDPIRAACSVCFLPIGIENTMKQSSAFLNINTPEELVKAQKISLQMTTGETPYNVAEKSNIQVYKESHAELVRLFAKSNKNRDAFTDQDFQTEIEKLANEFQSHQMHFWQGLSYEILSQSVSKSREILEEKQFWLECAANAYKQEHDFWINHKQPFVALHCLFDQMKLINSHSKDYKKILDLIVRYRADLFGDDHE